MKRAHLELKQRVAARMKELGYSQNECAELVRADSGNFSRLLRGHGDVGRGLAARIEREFGVLTEWWDEELPEEGSATGTDGGKS